MIFFLDTTSDVYILALATREGKLLCKKMIVRNERVGDTLLRTIRTFFKNRKPSAIIVVVGPGRFSGIRHGVTIANTLGFAWNVSVVGVKKSTHHDIATMVKHGIRLLHKQKFFSHLAVPAYGQEPNITIKKSSR